MDGNFNQQNNGLGEQDLNNLGSTPNYNNNTGYSNGAYNPNQGMNMNYNNTNAGNNNGGYNPNQGTNMNYSGGINMSNSIKAPDFMLWLLLGIAQICTLCCCNCFTFIFGILTVIFACMANTAFKNNNIAGYQSNIKTAKICNIIGWACIVLSIVLNIVTGLFSTVSDSLSSYM